MSLEQRLRQELDRAAPTSVPAPPSVATMQSVVAGRRRRNRVLLGSAAVALVAGLAAMAAVAAWPDSTEIVTTATDTDDGASDTAAIDATPAASDPGGEPAEADARGADLSGSRTPGSLIAAPAPDTIELTRLRVDEREIELATQQSPFDFAGGSGVLIAPVETGYAGLAARFGGSAGVSMIGVASDDGLAWREVELRGIPDGGTVSLLRGSAGEYVAAYSMFDVEAQRALTHLATSEDLVTWDLGPALPGTDTVVTDLAVGPTGVIAVGDAPDPLVWTGPVGGPYAQVGSIEGAGSFAGVVAIDVGFVAVGTSDGRPALFDSPDGKEWSVSAMTGIDSEDMVIELSVVDGVIMIAGGSGETAWAASSADGGLSWLQTDLGAGPIGTVAMGTGSISYLGTSSLGSTTLTMSDGTTVSSIDLDLADTARVELLATQSEESILLAVTDDGLTWVRARR